MDIVIASVLALVLLLFHCPIFEAIGILYSFFLCTWARIVVSENSSYGNIVVTRTRIGERILLINNGVIHAIHGEKSGVPDGYCYPGSGVADALLQECIVSDTARVALIGMGCGALLYYARKGQQWRCYEINPSIVELATHHDLFKFVASCPTKPIIFCVDGFSAVNQLRQQDVIIVDTFFGDHNVGSPEVLEKLIIGSDANTIFIFHVSGLSDKDMSTMSTLGTSCGFTAIIKETPSRDKELGRCSLDDFRYPFYMPSKWMVMSRDGRHISDLSLAPGWKVLV